MDDIEELATEFRTHHERVVTLGTNFTKAEELHKQFEDRTHDRLNKLEGKRSVERGAHAGSPQLHETGALRQEDGATRSIGEQFGANEEYKAFVARGVKGTARMQVRTITSGTAGAFVPPDRQATPIIMPRQALPLRSLLNATPTTSNLIHFIKQTLRTMSAAPVAENPQNPKPQSDLGFQDMTVPIQTIAHWIPASRQIVEDSMMLKSVIDDEMRYGLSFAEEQQLLYGDGTGNNLTGLWPVATQFDPTKTFSINNPTMFDALLQAVAQAELALLPATGIVMNPLDYRQMMAIKDSQSRYIGGGPFGSLEDRVWEVPKVLTYSMQQGHFMTGAFGSGAQLFDRMEAVVLVSTEDRDNFVKNMVTILCEERVALAIKRPQAFIKGMYVTIP